MERKTHLVQLPEWPEEGESEGPLLIFPPWPSSAGPLPRNLRNPHTEAYVVFTNLDAYAVKQWEFQSGEFIQKIFFPLWENKVDPDECVNKWLDELERGTHPQILAAEVAAAMCASAFRAYSSGETAAAWSYAIDAESWYVTLLAGVVAIKARRDAISKKASEAAKSKNSTPRAWVLAEWNNRNDKDQGKAAFARQFVPLVKNKFQLIVTTETISRDWLPKTEIPSS